MDKFTGISREFDPNFYSCLQRAGLLDGYFLKSRIPALVTKLRQHQTFDANYGSCLQRCGLMPGYLLKKRIHDAEECSNLLQEIRLEMVQRILEPVVLTPGWIAHRDAANAWRVEIERVQNLIKLARSNPNDDVEKIGEGLVIGCLVASAVLLVGSLAVYVFSHKFDGVEASVKADLLRVAMAGKEEMVAELKKNLGRPWLKGALGL